MAGDFGGSEGGAGGGLDSPSARRSVDPVRLVASGAVLSVLLLTLLGFIVHGIYRAHAAERGALSLERTINRIAGIDEMLTRSVRIAVVSGDPAWRTQFEQLASRVEEEARRLEVLAGPVGGAAAAARVRTSNLRMLEMEREVLALGDRGERMAALQRLSAPEYNEQEEVVSSSLQEIGNAAESFLHRSDELVRSRIRWGGLIAVVVMLTLVALWLRVLHLLRRHLRERDRAAQALAASEAELSALIRSMDDVVLVLDAEGRYLEVAPTGAPLLRPPEELPGKHLRDLVAPEVADRFGTHIRRAIETGQTQHLQYSLSIEGQTVWRSAAVSPMPGERVVWVARDITELMRAKERSRAEQAYLRTVIDTSPSLIFAKDREGRFTLANRAVAEVYKATPEELVGKTDADFNANPAEVEAFLRADRQVIDSGEELLVPEEPVTDPRTGEVRWFHTRKVRLLPPDGAPPQMLGIATNITERKQAEEALREASQRLRSHFEQAMLGVVELDRAGTIRNWNPAAERIFGYPKQEVLGAHWSRLTPEAERPRVEGILAQVLETRRARRSVNENLTRDGEVRICEWHNAPLLDARGEVVGFAALVQDITDRTRVEWALRESEERFRQLAENIREVFWIASPDASEISYVSPAYEHLTGRTQQSVHECGHVLWAAVHPDDQEHVANARGRMAAGEPVDVELRIRHESGSIRWVRVRSFPILGERGEPHRTVGVAEDVTERKRAELERAEAEAHYRRLVTNSPEGIYALDAGGFASELNPALERLLDRPREQVLGHHFSEFIAPEDLSETEAAFTEVISGRQERLSLEVHLVRPSGEQRRVYVSAVAITDHGSVRGVHGIIHDVTDERARQERMRLLAVTLDNLTEGVVITDADERVIYTNMAVSRILGFAPEHLTHVDREDFIPDDAARRQAEEIGEALGSTGRWSGRVERRRLTDGRLIQLDVMAEKVPTGDRSEAECTFSIFRDVTEDVDRERYLRRAERLASLGTLVRGVAHELNNPLHAIRNFADLMLIEERSDDDREALVYIRQEADRAAQVVADMHRFARQSDEVAGDRSVVNLNEAVREALRLHQYAMRSGSVELEVDLADELPPVRVNRNDAERVILSLLSNAEHAMENGTEEQRLIVRTRRSELGVAVEVVDSGPGIPTEDQERIFDPFWTTKGPGEGRGLGLSVAHSIVMEHGGEIRVDSEPAGGARFTVDLPLAEDLEEPRD